MRAILTVGLVLALACGSAGDEKKDDKKEPIDGKKLAGKWELTRPTAIAKVVAEFRGDGKMSVTVSIAEVDDLTTGDYKLDGNKLTVALRGPDGEERKVVTVTRLTDDALEYEVAGAPYSFKRVKDKDKK